MRTKNIIIKGARVNNLKNIDVTLPLGEFIVVTGLSGSGKSSLAFDTIYAEGQRRYVESLSSYARQFLGRMRKPECDYIKGLPPAIAIEQEVQGIVRIEFVVGKDGSISQMKVLKSLSKECDAEAMRVIRSAKWTPGKDEQGNAITSIKVQEVQYVLQ